MMGRRKGERRLAEPVFKMADRIMADGGGISNFENRPFHHAYLDRKLPCPHISCRNEAGKVFFQEIRLAQHFRVKHAAVSFDEEKYNREAWRMFKLFHGEETKRHLDWLSAERLLQVCFYITSLVCMYVFYGLVGNEYSWWN